MLTQKHVYGVGTLCLLMTLAQGCGESRNSASVTGKVLLNGQPLENVIVRFEPIKDGNSDDMEVGMSSYGETDANGEFALRFTDDDSAGALIGEHVVVVDERTPPEEEDNDAGGIGQEPVSRIPDKWRNSSQHYTVKEGSNEAVFELSQ